jgi:hypothetical protein
MFNPIFRSGKIKKSENDPDTLQILDEQDGKWVKQWKKATDQKPFLKNDLEVLVEQMEIVRPSNLKKKDAV